MPGYGVLPADRGSGLLPWAWAEERLAAAHDYWLATVWPDGRPHVMPVWGLWLDRSLWFSSSLGSRKTRNLLADPRCVVTTDQARQPVVVEGQARLVTDRDKLAEVLAAENAKYSTAYGPELLDPDVNACFQIVPRWVFALADDDFTGSPTKWVF